MNQLSTIDTTVPEQFTVAGVAIRQDAHERFCLNDIHKAAGNEKRHGPSNPHETQPHWYADSFGELLDMVYSWKA